MHIYVVYALVTLYSLCYQLQSPIEPFLVTKLLNKTDTISVNNNEDVTLTFARVKSITALCQGIGALLFGNILDTYGVRVGLSISFFNKMEFWKFNCT